MILLKKVIRCDNILMLVYLSHLYDLFRWERNYDSLESLKMSAEGVRMQLSAACNLSGKRTEQIV